MELNKFNEILTKKELCNLMDQFNESIQKTQLKYFFADSYKKILWNDIKNILDLCENDISMLDDATLKDYNDNIITLKKLDDATDQYSIIKVMQGSNFKILDENDSHNLILKIKDI